MQIRCTVSTIKAMSAPTALLAKAIGADEAFTDSLALIERQLFIDKPMRDPLIVLMVMEALKLFLVPSKRTGVLMDLSDVVEKALHTYGVERLWRRGLRYLCLPQYHYNLAKSGR